MGLTLAMNTNWDIQSTVLAAAFATASHQPLYPDRTDCAPSVWWVRAKSIMEKWKIINKWFLHRETFGKDFKLIV